MTDPIWRSHIGSGPLVATAIHDGTAVRDELFDHLALDKATRLREEDPFTAEWTSAATTWIAGTRSRFEVDLNRPREKAVYRTPEDAWGLTVWKTPPPAEMIERSLAEYDAFYAMLADLYDRLASRHGAFVVFDLHSYNHRRAGPTQPAVDPRENPAVNVGTGTMPDRRRFARVIDRFMADLSAYDFPGGALDVRENVKFLGGHHARWTHTRHPDAACVLAIEFKKFFMDEWTGQPDRDLLDAIREALASTIPGVLQELARIENPIPPTP